MLKRKNSRRKLLRHRKQRIRSKNRLPNFKRPKIRRRMQKVSALVPLSQNKIRTPQRPKLKKKKLRKLLL